MRKKLFTFLLALAASVGMMNAAVDGKLSGAFTVNAGGDQVYFSQGNLQYQASTNTCRFAEHQYDFIGDAAGNNTESGRNTQSDWIDLFGWATSGNSASGTAYQPWQSSTTDSEYGPAITSGQWTYANSDWGINPISNGGNVANSWRTLTQEEWDYILNGRATENRFCYAKLTIGYGLGYGLIILPDDWDPSYYALSAGSMNQGNHSYDSNEITAEDWTNSLEAHGAVFLPITGSRNEDQIYGIDGANSSGLYWSSTAGEYYKEIENEFEPEQPIVIDIKNGAYALQFAGGYYIQNNVTRRATGVAVRLVYTEPSGDPTPANVCGDGLTWELNGGVLTISYDGVGTGEMYDFDYEYDENPVNVAPWKENKSAITTVIVGDGVKSIGNYAFNDLYENFTAVTIANSVERIGVFAFTNAKWITEITLPSSLKTIDRQCFSANFGITSITIPSGVTSIGYQAFSYCTGLTSLTCEATTPPTLDLGVFSKIRQPAASISSIPLYVPSESVDAYEAAAQWTNFDIHGYDPAPTPEPEPEPAGYTEVSSFEALQAALQAGNNVRLTANISCTSDITLNNGQKLILDGNGFALNGAGSHRAFYFGGDVTIVMKDLTINAFDLDAGGGAIRNYGTLVLDGCTVSGNHTDGINQGGGAIENGNNAKLYAYNTTFSGNYSSEIGGAINNYRGNLYLANCSFENNYTTVSSAYYGGAIGINNGNTNQVRIINCSFSENKYGTNAGASDLGIYSNPSEYTIAGCTGISIQPQSGSMTTYNYGTATLDYSDLNDIQFSYTYSDTAPTPSTPETSDNVDGIEEYIESLNGNTTDLIINRTMYKDGYFNTLCLPFSMNASEIAASCLAGCELFEFESATANGGGLDLYIAEADAIVAGKPYLIRWASGENLTSLSFTGVTITASTGQAVGEGVQFVGTIGRTQLENGNENHLFLGANNTLYWPNTNNKLKGFRAYFLVSGDVAPHGAPARVVVRPKTPTAIENVNVNAKAVKLLRDGQLFIIKNGVKYNAQGQIVK